MGEKGKKEKKWRAILRLSPEGGDQVENEVLVNWWTREANTLTIGLERGKTAPPRASWKPTKQ